MHREPDPPPALGPFTPVALLAALPSEASMLQLPGIGALSGNAAAAVAVAGGVGARLARAAAERALAHGCRGLVSWGCAAALAPQLQAGDLVLGHCALLGSEEARPATTADPELVAALERALRRHRIPVTVGAVADTATVLATPAEKARMHAATGALAADMETAAIALCAARAGVAWAALRAVVDDARMTIPSCVVAGLAGERLRMGAILFGVLSRPGDAVRLVELARAYRGTRGSLRRAARSLGW